MRKLFKLGAYQILFINWVAVMVYWQYFIIFCFISGSKFLSPSMKAFVRICACAVSLDHLDFRLFMFGSHGRNQDEFTVSFISRQKFIFLFFLEFQSCSNFERMRILLIIWIAACQYFIIKF